MSANIILTGSTGNLGCYLLDVLIQSPQVHRIFLLNRSSNSNRTQQSSLEKRGLTIPQASKITYHTCDFSKPDLGLKEADYEHLVATTTHILHCAWPVDWNKNFTTFEAPIRSITYLIELTRKGLHNPLLFFVSSSAVVGNWGAVPGTKSRVPESEIDDWKVARFGYGQAKLVAERLLADATRQTGITAAVCRVGQVCGPVDHGIKGVWPPQEWFPSLVASSKYLKVLPDSLGPMNDIDWVPVDSLAKIIVQLLFCKHEQGFILHHHVVNPQTVPWATLLPSLRKALGEDVKIVRLPDWFKALETSSDTTSAEVLSSNPCLKLMSFFDNLREKAVHLPESRAPRLDIKHTAKRSETLRGLPPVSPDNIRMWLRQWGFRHGEKEVEEERL